MSRFRSGLGGEHHGKSAGPRRFPNAVVAVRQRADRNAGVVDENVDATELLHDKVNDFARSLGIAYVELKGPGASARREDLVGDGLDALFVQVRCSDEGAFVGKEMGGCAPHAACRTRDQGHLACD